MRAMEKLVAEGLVKFIGVSNFDVEELSAAERSLKNERMACDQVLHHLGYRGIERHLLSHCTEHEIAVVGYAPFGHSNFPSSQSAGGRVLEEIGERYGRARDKSPSTFSHHPNIFTIAKTSRPERAIENSNGVDWELLQKTSKLSTVRSLPDQDTPLEMI